MKDIDIKVGYTIRKGRKVVKKAITNKGDALALLVDAFQGDVSEAMVCFPTLKEGNTFKFKHQGFNVTLEPLHNHIDNY